MTSTLPPSTAPASYDVGRRAHHHDVPAVRLDALRRTFPGAAGGAEVVAVDHVDLEIGTGEIIALLGPNGAGKTTTLDVVLGLVPPSSGTARVLGRAPREAVDAGLVSAVLQTGGLLADLTVRETLEYVAATYRRLPTGSASVADVLERTGLTALAGRRVSTCSGGEQQRLRFALALLPDPSLLVLDEPTAAMDVAARREFWATMHDETARGRTVVFATHYLEEADAFADRIVLMAGGRVVADGSTAEVRARATGRVVSASVTDPSAAVAAADRLRALLPSAVADVEVQGARLRVCSAAPDAVARALLVDLGAHDLEVVSGSLDEAFLLLTEEHR
ncbi:MAG: multidrug ABC transporter ATP-binding protein [Nocardioides sp.]|nr:multidrug ABC transporter ATP-binding protein [Nocardioides sp.]